VVAFLYRVPSGIAGASNRIGAGATIEPGLLHTSLAPTAYGLAVAIDASTGRYRAIGSGDTAALVVGVLIRPYPSINTVASADVLGATTPSTTRIADIMKRGYVTVTLNGATAAAKGGLVYIRVAAASGGKPIGGFEAAADSTNTIVLPGTWYWMGPADAQGNVELACNI
jgi:hypothetical protein